MRVKNVLAVAAELCITLAACGGSNDANRSASSAESAFVDDVQQQLRSYGDEARLIRNGRDVCARLAALDAHGWDGVRSLNALIHDAGDAYGLFNDTQVINFAKAATEHLCPEWKDNVTAALQ